MTRNPTTGFPAIAALAADLADERLAGAACAGLAPMFDTDSVRDETDAERDARHAAAADICARCPVRDQCRTAAAELGSSAIGVWAAELRNQSRGRGRPPKATA